MQLEVEVIYQFLIEKNKKWVDFAYSQLVQAKEQLKKDMIEYEKFNYLEVQEMKHIIKKQKEKESKDLDEVIIRYMPTFLLTWIYKKEIML